MPWLLYTSYKSSWNSPHQQPLGTEPNFWWGQPNVKRAQFRQLKMDVLTQSFIYLHSFLWSLYHFVTEEFGGDEAGYTIV